jgi:hypothetical protein
MGIAKAWRYAGNGVQLRQGACGKGSVTSQMSIELHYDGKITCEFGEVAAVFGRSKTPGVVHDVAPLILVDGSRGWDDITRGWALVGVDVQCDGRYLRVSADNGSWVWELAAAHWDSGWSPLPDWSSNVLLGRWRD